MPNWCGKFFVSFRRFRRGVLEARKEEAAKAGGNLTAKAAFRAMNTGS